MHVTSAVFILVTVAASVAACGVGVTPLGSSDAGRDAIGDVAVTDAGPSDDSSAADVVRPDDSGACPSGLYLVSPCCGGGFEGCFPATGGTCPAGSSYDTPACPHACVATPCVALSPFCAELPASCAGSTQCMVPGSGCSGTVDASAHTVECICI